MEWIRRRRGCAGKVFREDSDWGADWGVEAEELWGTLSLVGEPSARIKTERGDYRGFYANVRDAIEKKAPLEVTPEQALRTMRADRCWRTRAAANGVRWSGENQPSELRDISAPSSRASMFTLIQVFG